MLKKKRIDDYLIDIVETCKKINSQEITEIYEVLVEAIKKGGRIFIIGNGGSASTASHFQTDLNNAFSLGSRMMPAVCLVDNISTITAISNDYSYEDIFLKQIEHLLNKNDVLIAISGSGNSKNVIKAAEYTKRNGNIVIALVGFDGGKLKKISNYSFHAPVNNMQVSEDMHLLFCHLLSTLIREEREN